MSKIRDLLDKRVKSFETISDRILKEIENNVIPAILDMLDLNANELDKLEWNTVHLEEDHLVLTGSIKYEEGDVISDGDQTITLDTTMALILDKLIRVGIPMNLAENGTKDDVYEHLQESQRQLREDYEAVYGHEPPTMEEALEEATQQQLGMDFRMDFDYNKLTEEQQEAMWMWGSMVDYNPWESEPN